MLSADFGTTLAICWPDSARFGRLCTKSISNRKVLRYVGGPRCQRRLSPHFGSSSPQSWPTSPQLRLRSTEKRAMSPNFSSVIVVGSAARNARVRGMLVSAGADGCYRIWDVGADCRSRHAVGEVTELHKGSPTAVRLAPNAGSSGYLFTAGKDGVIQARARERPHGRPGGRSDGTVCRADGPADGTVGLSGGRSGGRCSSHGHGSWYHEVAPRRGSYLSTLR